MKIRDVMSMGVVSLGADETTRKAVEVMEINGIHHLVVNDDGEQMVGVISMQDIRLIENIGSRDQSGDITWEPFVIDDVAIRHLMSKPVITLGSQSPVRDAATIMLDKGIHCLPVVEDETVVGIITEKDLLAAIAAGKMGEE